MIKISSSTYQGFNCFIFYCYCLAEQTPDSCHRDQYRCLDGGCIPLTWKCDGQTDCDDDSDEGSFCRRFFFLELTDFN